MTRCSIKYCPKLAGSRGVLCADHWTLVPSELKRQVWREWRAEGRQSDRFTELTRRAVKIAARRDQFENALERDNWTDERKR